MTTRMVETCSLTLYNINKTVVLTCRSINCIHSFIHSFMVYLVTPIGNSEQPLQNNEKIQTAKTQWLISEP